MMLGIDIGTTTISAAAGERTGRALLAVRTIPNDTFIRGEAEWEKTQDAERIVEKAKALADELLEAFPGIRSIGLAGQMHGIVYLDREGRGVSPLFTWQDQRGDLPAEDGETASDVIFRKTGYRVPAGYGLATHLYNLKTGLVPRDAVTFCTIHDYLGMRLAGRKKPLVHACDAASFGLFDAEAGSFREEAVRAAGMDPGMLPEVTSSCEILGEYRGRSVYTAIGDNQASFLGSAGNRTGVALLNMGTGGQISVLSDRYTEIPGIETRPFLDGKWLLVGATLCGGRAYAALERFFRSYVKEACGTDAEQYDVMERLASRDLCGDTLSVNTTFEGTRLDPGLRGSITNISCGNLTPAGLITGVMRGMARELFDMNRAIEKGTGEKTTHVILAGNGFRKNRRLREITRDLFQAETEISPVEEEAAWGAAVSSARE